MSTPYDQDKDDPLAPAKGISLGVFLGTLSWAGLWALIVVAGGLGFLAGLFSYILWLMP